MGHTALEKMLVFLGGPRPTDSGVVLAPLRVYEILQGKKMQHELLLTVLTLCNKYAFGTGRPPTPNMYLGQDLKHLKCLFKPS